MWDDQHQVIHRVALSLMVIFKVNLEMFTCIWAMNYRIPLNMLLFGLLLVIAVGDTMGASFKAEINRLLPSDGKKFGKIGNETVYGKYFIRRMYQENKFRPLWDRKAISSLSRGINSLAEDGLNPRDYQFGPTKPYLKAPSKKITAKVDILLTEAYLRALYNLYYGKTDPLRLDPNNNFAHARDGKDRSVLFLAWIQKGRIGSAFNWARPKNDRYRWLKDGLVGYQRIKAAGGWPRIPKGKTLRPGDQDKRISLIRKRLAITGDLLSDEGPNSYEETLQDGILNFQERHYLKIDGIVGPGTFAAMNVPVSKRIDQIRVNMERQRWLFPEQSTEYLVVDIAGFNIFLIKNRDSVWQERVQVGQGFTKTPVFKSKLKYVEFNPAWTVPDVIKQRTILPALKKDPDYLKKEGYQLLDGKGMYIEPNSVDWNNMQTLPYTVLQRAGPKNALGRVKYMFPNKHDVFLHDIGHSENFNKRVRTSDSGSIRLNNALDLAEVLLENQRWDRREIDRVVASGKTKRVNLKKPMPILIHYSTAWAIETQVFFKKDIYSRDPGLLADLNGPFIFHTPDMKKGSPTKKPLWQEIMDALGGSDTNDSSETKASSGGFLDH